ncbi:hypothetical protein XENOCAPTIV_011201 [Xenoophorus captivus]|uniref:Uncharacterized protein n=1 Tax=Xenoophorus captivus TaxID=1517983 RepID=A0ABV0QLN5_9TELE
MIRQFPPGEVIGLPSRVYTMNLPLRKLPSNKKKGSILNLPARWWCESPKLWGKDVFRPHTTELTQDHFLITTSWHREKNYASWTTTTLITMTVERVWRDESFIDQMKSKLDMFYFNTFIDVFISMQQESE